MATVKYTNDSEEYSF
jgi:hypothetical protein